MARVAPRRSWPCIALLALACGDAQAPAAAPAPDASQAAPPASAGYVGAQACGACHADVLARWRGSDHDLAMQRASAETLLGDFSSAELSHHGQRFRFERRGERHLIHSAGADGTPRDFEVAYSFGVRPLQQYLVALPGGRLHAVAAAWDARPASQGGQRWFHLPEHEAVPPGDVLHWTGLAGSWNAMCADCHSTNLVKGYDPEQDAYTPSWSEPNVSCEACHGPASQHLEWAQHGVGDAETRGLLTQLSDPRVWQFVAGEPIARRDPPVASRREIDSCAPCHSRRSRIADAPPGTPFLDAYRPALLEPGLYFPDGQIRDEVYEWGSFVQSRMYAAGVVCSDCHDPHALRIEVPDATCARCHASAVFATPEHHQHAEGSTGSSCVACHMPARTYMAVDDRRDHGFRVPRPDLSLSIGVPNACTGCHADRDAAWAVAALAQWPGGAPGADARHFATILDAAQRQAPGANADLATLAVDADQPAIVRASAVSWLGTLFDAQALPALLAALEDEDALVRFAAAGAAEWLAPPDRQVSLLPLLRDPLRLVRIEAARVLAPLAERIGDAAAQRDLAAALAEYRHAQWLSADRPEARTNLGSLAAQQGEFAEAQRQFEAARRVGPFFLPAYLNLSELQRRQGREDAAERVLREALARVPDSAEVHHALGLALVRSGRPDAALAALARAAELSPESPRYAYVHGIALSSQGERESALQVLDAALRQHPSDPDLLFGLATLHRDAGNREAALAFARRLAALRPADAQTRALVQELEQAPTGAPDGG